MNPKCAHRRRSPAFTLVELLVVVAIIALLVAILVPAFGKVREQAKVTQTQAQYNALDTGIELFRAESDLGGGYPPSWSDNSQDAQLIANPKLNDQPPGNNGQDPVRVSGGQLLVHALVGADGLGPPGFRDFNRNGRWWDDTHDTFNDGPEPDGAYALDPQTGREVHVRYGEAGYVDDKMRESMRSPQQLVNEGRIINPEDFPNDLAVDEAFFVDPWGTPILYYRASRASNFMVAGTNQPGVYRPQDNSFVTGLQGSQVPAPNRHVGFDFGAGRIAGADNTARLHAISNHQEIPDPAGGVKEVEKVLEDSTYVDSLARFIVDPDVKARPTPVRKDSYLLISAGKDGRYGTSDDVTNWTRRQD